MARDLVALVGGILFGIGLSVSQMINPAKIHGFLDVAGAWDPSLAFVMGGAVAVNLVAFRFILKQPAPRLDAVFQVPTASAIDARLLGGAAVFGVGWGLSGFCPGPAVAALSLGDGKIAVFVLAMLAGMTLHGFMAGPRRAGAPAG